MKVVLKTNADYSKVLPTYVDFEDIFAALEEVRKANQHGYGYNEPMKDPDDPKKTAVWANLEDPANGLKSKDYPKNDAGNGAVLPYVMEEYPPGKPPKTRVVGGGSPKRSNCVTATFNALAIALAQGRKDESDHYTPFTSNGRLNMDAYRKWFAIKGDDDGVKALVHHNLGVAIQPKKTRRGDVIQINWNPSGSHCTYCWDSAWDGEEIFVQAISSQTMTNGVDVVPSLEELGAFGKSIATQRREKTSNSYVISRSRTEDWLTTHAARAHFRRFGAYLRETGDTKKLDTGLLMQNFGAGRFHRLFPRYPIALGGSVHVSRARTRDASSELYFDNNESDKGAPRHGGFFPVGAARSWHGGVHLYPEASALGVHAPVDGVLVAARITTAKNRSEYGDTGFVLLKTKLEVDSKEIAFFTLLAHLREPTADEHASVPWLDELLQVPTVDDHRWQRTWEKKKFYYGILDPPEEAATAEGRSGDGEDGSLLFFKKQDVKSETLGRFVKGDVVEILTPLQFNGWAKVKALDGDLAGKEGFIHAAGRVERVHTHSLDPELKEARRKLLDGDVVDFSKLERKMLIRSGEKVGHAGTIGGETAIHFAVFSKDLIGVNGKTKADIEDTDTDLFMDRSSFEERFFGGDEEKDKQKQFMIKGRASKEDGLLLGGEICQFYARSPLRKNMRTLVTRHPSEWGDRVDWSKLDSQPQWKHVDPARRQKYKDEVKKLSWWTSGLGKDADLPEDQVVHHYHPIDFLRWLDQAREQDTTGKLHLSVFELNHGG